MKRMMLSLKTDPQKYVYLDSVHAALVAGLSEAGLSSDELVGRNALPWTFACQGRARPGGVKSVFDILLSTPDEKVAAAFENLNLWNARVQSSNGDKIDLSRGQLRDEKRGPSGSGEVCVMFASPFCLIQKTGQCEKTRMISCVDEGDIREAIEGSVKRRLGGAADIEVAIDKLTLMTQSQARWVRLRNQNGMDIKIPAFNMPVTLRGDSKDIDWIYHAGIGAKTRQGFGCPLMPN